MQPGSYIYILCRSPQ